MKEGAMTVAAFVFFTAAVLLLSMPFVAGAPPQPAPTKVSSGGSSMLSGANITAIISHASPSAEFYAPEIAQKMFRMRYARVIAFNDTGDGAYQGVELRYFADLMTATWSADSTEAEVSGGGESVCLRLRVTLTLQPREGGTWQGGAGQGGNGTGHQLFPIINALRLTLSYELHQYNASYGSGSDGLVLHGGSEVKVGIHLEPLATIPATHFSLEQSLGSGDEEFRLYDAAGPKVAHGSTDEIDGSQQVMHVLTNRASMQQRIGFMDESGAELGFYSWVSRVGARKAAGSSNGTLTTSYRTDGTSLKVYASFGATPSAIDYYIDPTMGISPDVLQEMLENLVDYLAAHRQSVAIGVGAGGAAAIAVIGAKGFAGRKRDDVLTLEKNRYYRSK